MLGKYFATHTENWVLAMYFPMTAPGIFTVERAASRGEKHASARRARSSRLTVRRHSPRRLAGRQQIPVVHCAARWQINSGLIR